MPVSKRALVVAAVTLIAASSVAYFAIKAPTRAPVKGVPEWLLEGPIYETHPYYYNGTLKDITERIPELADLGVKTIYLLPIWEHRPMPPEGHPFRYGYIYHITDYHKISPEFGTEEDLRELVETAHRYDMRVILEFVSCMVWEDGVIYKNGWTLSVPLAELQKKFPLEYVMWDNDTYVCYNCNRISGWKGEYLPGWFLRCDVFGKVVGGEVKLFTYPYPAYGYAVDRTNPKLINYLTGVAEYYVKEFDGDGFRVDAPGDNWNPEVVPGDRSSIELLRRVNEAIKRVEPDAVLISEMAGRYEYRAGWRQPDPVFDEMCELSFSYYFYNNLMASLPEIDTEKLLEILNGEKVWYGRARVRFLELHGQRRINELAPELNKPLLVLISTIPGVPSIQAGQEVGATNAFLPNAPVDWEHGDYELRDFYRKVFKIRNNNDALKFGSIRGVWKSGDKMIAFLRSYEEEKAIVLINMQSRTVSSTLSLPLEPGTVLYDALNDERFVVSDPKNFKVTVPAYGSRILIAEGGA